MCGICGFIGPFPGVDHVFYGIEMLLNRGYDSTGICGIHQNHDNGKMNFKLNKYATTPNETAINLLKKHKPEYSNITGPLLMHTRWATCGQKTDTNSHPLTDYTESFSIVHNGIIDNYNELKHDLVMNHGVTFKSETDSEVIVNLISVEYSKCQDVYLAINNAISKLRGIWAIGLMTVYEPNRLYTVCKDLPMLVGYGDGFMMIASEQSAISKYVNKYSRLNDNDLVYFELVNHDNKHIVKFSGQDQYMCSQTDINVGVLETTPYPFEHWTLKEIHDQSTVSLDAINGRILNNIIALPELNKHINKLRDIRNVIILGCGTSYHASLYVCNIFKQLAGMNIVQVFDGAEFSELDIPKNNNMISNRNTMLIFVSQSGETRDLYQCVEIGKKHGLFMLGIINSIDSTIARKMDTTVYLNCGREVAVASTKAFTNQVIVMSLVACWFSQLEQINYKARKHIIDLIIGLPGQIDNVIKSNIVSTREIAKDICGYQSLFLIGKGYSEIISKEGALKIKEIGYIHAEAYNSLTLKHGPFSLLANDIPVIMIIMNDQNLHKNNAVLDEIVLRSPNIYGISDIDINDPKFKKCLHIPQYDEFGPLLANLLLQLIAYNVSLCKSMNPDRPLNLAKVITV